MAAIMEFPCTFDYYSNSNAIANVETHQKDFLQANDCTKLAQEWLIQNER